MNLKIIIPSILLLFLIIGTAYAITNNDLKAPTPLHKMGLHSYVDEKGHNIDIINYTDNSYKTFFENDTDYLVEPYRNNDSYYFYVDSSEVDPDGVEAVGILEVIEYGGDKLIISSWTPNDEDKDIKLIYTNLMEFNKLNKLTPIKI